MGTTEHGADGSTAMVEGSGSEEGSRRGLLARIFGAFLPAPAPSSPGDTPTIKGSAAPIAPQPGLGALRRMRVDDVAVPKVDVIAVPLDITRDELAAVFREHGFSRLPVYKGTLDKPVGLVMFKDFALTYGFGAGSGKFSLRKLLRPILYAPPSMRLAVLLQKMQTERVHMALVIDEYGGVDGVVTIEDLLETVVGDISDEHDEDEGRLWIEEKPGVFLVQATAPLDEFEAVIGQSLRTGEDDGEIDTLGGLLFLRLGRVPARGEVVANPGGAEFEVIDADPRRIKRLRVHLRAAVRERKPPVTATSPAGGPPAADATPARAPTVAAGAGSDQQG
jgi:magnesium and cobalt transporter